MPPSPHPVYVVKAAFFRALGHPVRVRILELLSDHEYSVGELQSVLSLDSSGTSQHLAALKRVGLVQSRREGTSVIYQAKDERILDLLAIARVLVAASIAENQELLRDLDE